VQKMKLAIIVAPLTPGLLWAAFMQNPAVLLFAVPIAYFGMFAFGLPLYFLARRYWRVSALTCMVGGSLSGALSGLGVLWWDNSLEMSLSFAVAIILFAVFGFVAGFHFWWLHCAHRLASRSEGTRASSALLNSNVRPCQEPPMSPNPDLPATPMPGRMKIGLWALRFLTGFVALLMLRAYGIYFLGFPRVTFTAQAL
jgi:hypothetical protein